MTNKTSLLASIQTGLIESHVDQSKLQWVRDLPGGDINQAAFLKSDRNNWFVKYRNNAPVGMFKAEAAALATIAAAECIRVPAPIAYGMDGNTAWLVLEYLELTSSGPAALLGEQLAELHSVTNQCFGWSHDNFIGTTPQQNDDSENWTEFWRNYRLKPQLAMAKSAGFNGRLYDRGERLLASLNHLMQDHEPSASLLHGDLWAGNKAFTASGQPVIFDPASYFGDRETDVAMTELFGGFGQEFYSAYHAHSPLPDGYPLRRELYNLYHMLNHLNLFGSAYLSRCESMIDGLLAQVD